MYVKIVEILGNKLIQINKESYYIKIKNDTNIIEIKEQYIHNDSYIQNS